MNIVGKHFIEQEIVMENQTLDGNKESIVQENVLPKSKKKEEHKIYGEIRRCEETLFRD